MKRYYLFSIVVNGDVFKYVHRALNGNTAIIEVKNIIKNRSKIKGKFKLLYRKIDLNGGVYTMYVDKGVDGNNTYRSLVDSVLKKYPTSILLNPKPKVVYLVYIMRVVVDGVTYRYIGKTNSLSTRLVAHRSLLRRGKHPNKPLQKLYNRGLTRISCRSIRSNIVSEDEVNSIEFTYTEMAKRKYGSLSLNIDSGVKRSTETKKKISAQVAKRTGVEYTNKIIKNSPRSRPLTINGVYYLSIGDAARKLNVSSPTINLWAKKGIQDVVFHTAPIVNACTKVTLNNVTYNSIMDAHRATGISRKKIRKLIKNQKKL